MVRSAVNGITPKRDLVGYRYGFHPNCDLREALNFFGTTNARQFKFNLDLACKAFGVQTSKGEGMDGRSVEEWYRAGRHREIAEYCLEDVRATAQLYDKLATTLLVFNKEFRESDERERRIRIAEEGQGVLPGLMPEETPFPPPATDPTFMESVTQTSLTLTSALEEVEVTREDEAMTVKHQAVILEKLAAVLPASQEDEIPPGV
jgi:hypothetical protein